jgi:hypothetical protein
MKSLFQILGESVEKLTDQGKFKQYRERLEPGMSIESKIAVAQRVLKEVSESNRYVQKHNGAADNGHQEFRESADFRETDSQKLRKKNDRLLREALGIPEPKEPEGLSRCQLAEYQFGRSIGLSEAAALSLCKQPLRVPR